MKKCILFAAAALLFAAAPALAVDIQSLARPVAGSGRKGTITKYEINGLTVHTYASDEAYRDWTIIFENDKNLVMLEPQPMPASSNDLRRYVESLGKPLAAILTSYHGTGPDSYPGVPIYATSAAVDFVRSGRYEKTMRQFARRFPDFDVKVIVPNRTVKGMRLYAGDIEFMTHPDDHAYPMPGMDVALPTHKMYYMHALGGDSHAIVGSMYEIDPEIAKLEKLKDAGYDVFLTTHHAPETRADVIAKIAYLKVLKEAALAAKSKDEFIAQMKFLNPDKKGEQYLEMTAGNLFK